MGATRLEVERMKVRAVPLQDALLNRPEFGYEAHPGIGWTRISATDTAPRSKKVKLQ